MQKIIPHLWYATEAIEAATFYTSLFPQSSITHTTVLHNTPSGDCDVVSFKLWDQKFMAISAGPIFKFNPSISFMVNFDPLFFGAAPGGEAVAREKLDAIWKQLAEGGTVLMPLDEYPFSKRFGWVMDKYGLSWQLILTNPQGEQRPPIIPALMFVKSRAGQAESAINYYLSVFKHTKRGATHRYPAGLEWEKEGNIMFADFMLENSWFAAMDSSREHNFDFNEAISFLVQCADQAEIDYYWQKLSAVPASEQCGWCKDQFGVSWQITAASMEEMLSKGSPEQVARVTDAFMPMKKIDIATLKKAYEKK